MKTKQSGGKREGAGRPKAETQKTPVTIRLTASEETRVKAFVNEMREIEKLM